jgi:hypothetical protein
MRFVPPNYGILILYTKPMTAHYRTSTKHPGPDLPMKVLRIE